MATMPAQGDLLQVKYGSSGDYYPLAFYPNSAEECYRYAVIAFNAAEESRSPVILLSDAFVGHLNETVDLDATEVAVAPREIPPLGKAGKLYTGLAHDVEGRPRTMDADNYKAWIDEIKTSHQQVAAKYASYEYNGNHDSDTLLISFGIVSRVLAPLLDRFAHFRPIRIMPMLDDELRKAALKHRQVVVVEANDGQYAGLVEQAIKREVARVPLLGGRINLDLAKEGLTQRLGVEVT
jgi:2-oxoglutarate ferredoxin oxidoreductase subunit alpha